MTILLIKRLPSDPDRNPYSMRQATVIDYFLITLAGLALTACSAVPLNDKSNSVRLESPELSHTRAGQAEMISKFPAYENARLQTYVQHVASKLIAAAPATDLPIKVLVLDSPGFFAYSFAHGDIVIARGLLIRLQNETQLAAVLAHEIGHIILQHQLKSVQAYQRIRALEDRLAARMQTAQARETLGTLSYAKLRAYSRENEIEADTWSERLLREAGYPASGMAEVLQQFVQQEGVWDKEGFELWDFPEQDINDGVFATHPSSQARLDLAQQRLGKQQRLERMQDTAFLAAINGVRYGLPGALGVWRGQSFLNPQAGFGLTVPAGWYLFGSGDRLGLAPRNNRALASISMLKSASKETRLDALKKLAGSRRFTLREPKLQNGVSVALGVLEAAGSLRPLMLAVVDVGPRRLLLAAETGTQEDWGGTEKEIAQLLDSIRPLKTGEAEATRELQLHVEPAATVNKQAAQWPTPAAWQVMNQLEKSEQPDSKRLVKIIK